MNIVIATDTYPPHVNGAAYFTQRFARALVDNGHRVLVIAPSRSLTREKYSDQGVETVGVPSFPFYLNSFRVALPFTARTYLTREMTAFNPDVVHVQGHFYLAKATRDVARKLHLPVVGTNHFMPENLVHYLSFNKTLEKVVAAKMWKQCFAFFNSLDASTSPTQTAVDLFSKSGLKKPMLAISNGIDLDRFNPAVSGQLAKEKYHLPNKPTALFVGRLDKEKNLDLVIEAIAQVSQHLDVHLIIAGSTKGGDARRLQHLAEELQLTSRVTFTDFVQDDELPAVYGAADIFVMASTAELQSIATMEAMASGLPIIAARAIALPELVEPDVNGFLFEPNDKTALAQYLQRLLSDTALAQQMGTASREKISRHALKGVIKQFENIYREVIKVKSV